MGMGEAVGVVLMVLIAGPLVAALLASVVRIPARVWGPATAVAGFVLAVSVGIMVLAGGPVGVIVENGGGRVVAGVWADQVAAVLLVLVCGINAVVQVFARRYLYGDPRAGRFFTATAVLTTATTAAVTAVTLVGLALAWSAAGAALCVVLGMYGRLPAARDGVRRTARAFLIGDAALWAAVAVIVIRWGDLDLRAGVPTPVASAGFAEVTVLGLLLVVAAASRSAQVPFHRWLPVTLAAPTPVSALLHAGVVNAGAILLLRTAPVFASSTVAMHAAFAVGGVTMVYATVLMLTKPDIKGALVHSTMGQMGFMIMTCGLGLFAAAIFHLTAHGMYKATLFLGSGAAVHRHVRARHAPPVAALSRAHRVAVAGFAVIAPVVALAVAATVLPAGGMAQNSQVLMAFAWAAGAWGSWAWLARRPSIGRAAAAGATLLTVIPAYLAAIEAFTAFLKPALPAVRVHPPSGWLVVVVAAVLAAATVIRLAPRLPGIAAAHDLLYVWALTHARPGIPTTAPVTAIAAARRDASAARVGAPA